MIAWIKKNKKRVLIIIFLFGYSFFWLWFFGERKVAIGGKENKSKIEKQEVDERQENKKISFKDLGDFWLEINTEKVKVKAPIVNGVTDDKLEQGLGRHKTTAFPNREKGNVVISGHRWKFGDNPAYKVFEDLDKLKEGDKISVHYKEKKFVYEVMESRKVDSKEVSILEQTEVPQLTIYTCTPKFTAFKRLVFVAKLISE